MQHFAARHITARLKLLHQVLLTCICGLVLLWSGSARAQSFAPECDAGGASGIAPLPVYPKDQAEVSEAPCAPLRNVDLIDGLPMREQPKPDFELSGRHAVPSSSFAIIAPAVSESWLIASFVQRPHACAYSVGVYRPPR